MSSPIVVQGMLPSQCTQVVLATLYEKDVPFQFQLVNLAKGEHLTDKHKQLQPWGKVPVIVDGSFTLYESRAIAMYIASKYADQGNKTLLPTELHERAIYEQFVSIERSYISQYVQAITYQRVTTKFRGLSCDEKLVENAAAELKKNLPVFNQLLEGKQYLTGDQFTLVDLFHLPSFQVFSQTPEWSLVEAQPNVLAWWKRISSRPAWLKVTEQVQQFMQKMQQAQQQQQTN